MRARILCFFMGHKWCDHRCLRCEQWQETKTCNTWGEETASILAQPFSESVGGLSAEQMEIVERQALAIKEAGYVKRDWVIGIVEKAKRTYCFKPMKGLDVFDQAIKEILWEVKE